MEVFTIGGYSEVGKNMTAVKVGDDVVIFDAGLYLPPIVELEEKDRIMSEKNLRNLNAIPDDTLLDKLGLRNKVRAILIGHAHLDHVGAIPYIESRYKADILGSPFTINVLNTLARDESIQMSNKPKMIQPNSHYNINENLKVEFINVTHSCPQSSLIALHTKEGVVIYANDFKFDNSPQLGNKPNYDALKRLQKQGVKLLIVESLYAQEERKTPSEKVAKAMLEDVMLGTDNADAGMIITTFSSHIARLNSIVEFGKKLNRKIVFAGRSLAKYVNAAHEAKICPFYRNIKLLSYRKQMDSFLAKINKSPKEYLLVCTGHQGEPGSILDRIAKKETKLLLSPKDHVIFSSKTIPAEINIANKANLDKRLKHAGVRIFNDVHVSGHAGREDLRDFINMVKPEHIIPAHGDMQKLTALAELAGEMGYHLGKNCHIVQDLQSLKL